MAEEDPMPARDRRKLDAPAPGKRSKYRNTKRWCRGKVGVEHDWVITPHNGNYPCKLIGVGYKGYEPYWQCWHQETCANCKKVGRYFLNRGECPDMPPGTNVGRRWGLLDG